MLAEADVYEDPESHEDQESAHRNPRGIPVGYSPGQQGERGGHDRPPEQAFVPAGERTDAAKRL